MEALAMYKMKFIKKSYIITFVNVFKTEVFVDLQNLFHELITRKIKVIIRLTYPVCDMLKKLGFI